MKLKKIVSLALAGVMAVSMLAGCANNGGNGGNDSGKEPVTQPATGVAAAFNDAQSSTNQAKVVFSNDASLDAALAKAVKMNGQGAPEGSVFMDVCYITGMNPDLSPNYTSATGFDDFIMDEDDCKDGKTCTFAGVGVVSSEDAWSEDAAVNLVASYLDGQIKLLKDTTYVEKVTPAGHTFYDFSYTGKASMVSVQNAAGDYDYYFAIVVTQTCKADVRNG